MGRIFVLCGASGVGKTTLLDSLQQRGIIGGELQLIPRYTNRPRRPEEAEGFEYQFCSYEAILQKVSASDFVYIEKWGDHYRGIEGGKVRVALKAAQDSVILASVQGAEVLRDRFGGQVIIMYLWPGSAESLRDLSPPYSNSEPVREIERRLALRISQGRSAEPEREPLSDEVLLKKRMIDNYLDIAAACGRLRTGHRLIVIQGSPDDREIAGENFMEARACEPMPSAHSWH